MKNHSDTSSGSSKQHNKKKHRQHYHRAERTSVKTVRFNNMAEAYNPPVAGPTQTTEDNEQRIDGDGQEVNALRFMGLGIGGGGGGAPVPPPPAITPVATGVSQPLPPQQQQPPPPQAPLQPPPQAPQHQQPMPAPAGYEFPDPTAAYGSMQIPPGPMSGPYGMPGQMPGVLGGGPMMMMPPYNYMYPQHYYMPGMPGPYATMPPAPSKSSQQLIGYLQALRVKEPKLYREWHKKYTAHMRNPDRIPFPQVPGYQSHVGSSQTLPSHGRQRKESTRSSVNGDPYRYGHNESFADYSHVGGANTSMSHVYSRGHDRHRPSHSGRTSVNGDYRAHPEDDFDIDGADVSILSGAGGHSLMNSSHYERDRPQTQSGRSSTVGDPYRPGDVYSGYTDQQPDSLNTYDNSSYRFQPINEQVREPTPTSRSTPLKFSTFHCIATMSPLGHLIRIKNSGTVMEFVKLKQFVGHLPEYKEMESFPGPLIQGVTHKSTVIQFCKRKIQEAQSNSAQVDRDNFILLWKFLMLMIRQNGHVVGSDIAELLIEAVTEEKKKAIVVEEIRDDVEGMEDEDVVDTPPAEPTPPPVVEPKDEEKLVQVFCEHLLLGHKKDALDFAMDNGLWGHALFFASKMDERSYGHVLAKFANGIALNSPLQTLYHIMCGKQPASVTSCADETFGDWKPHLAMLLSNSGSRPDVEYKAILTLGDTLASRNRLYAAQFCYLMGREEFRKDSRLGPLLGYCPTANNLLEATQMTEVYEFALKLQDDPHLSLGVSFLQSKLDYSKSLVSYGFVQEALTYCEEITKTLKSRKIEDAEVQLCSRTLEIAERIAVADESGSANTTWVEDLKRIIAEPSAYCENSRKMSVLSSQEQSSEVSYASQTQQQIPSNETYDPNQYNQQQPLPPDIGNLNQYDPGVSATAVNSNTILDNNSVPGGGGGVSSNVQETNWSNPTQMNGGLHISSPMYDVTQQLSQMTMNTNTTSPASPYVNNVDGNYPSYDGGYPSAAGGGGYDNQPNVSADKSNQHYTNNNNNWYNNNQPYNPQQQPTVGPNDYSALYKEPDYNQTSAVKKKSVRFEDEHERHADVENSIGNGGVSVLRSRAPVRPDTLDLKSAMKSTIERHETGNHRSRPNFINGSVDTIDSKKGSDDSSGSPEKSHFEVEYKSTYPIDEPIESVSRLSSSSNNNSNSKKLRPATSSSSYEYHNTFPVDRECCDVDEPCEDHDEYLGDDSENGVPDFTKKCTGYEKTELANNPLPPQGSGNKKKEDGNKKKGKENAGGGLDNQPQQPGLFSRLFQFSLKPKNQMKLPDDKNPTILWDENQKRWVNTAGDGDDDNAPAGPPPKDSDLMRGPGPGPMPNGPMSMPPPNRNMQSVPPSANNMQAPPPNMSYQQAPAALHSLPNQMPTMNQPSQSPGMMNVPQQQQQQQPNNNIEPMIPGMPPVSNNSMNKYKLQKGRSLKNSYVDVLNPNSSRSPSEPPQLPVNNVSSPQVPNLFIPPPTNSGGDGPVSFLTAPSEEGPPGQDNSQVQAPPMFNPAQFQNPGYPQGQ